MSAAAADRCARVALVMLVAGVALALVEVAVSVRLGHATGLALWAWGLVVTGLSVMTVGRPARPLGSASAAGHGPVRDDGDDLVSGGAVAEGSSGVLDAGWVDVCRVLAARGGAA